MKRCVVTGASGFLGREVVRRLSAEYKVIGVGHTHAGPGMITLDLRDRDAVQGFLAETNPDVLVHLAACRDPDTCEQNPEETRRVNVDATQNLCDALAEGAPMIYASTDYAFDGLEPPFTEEDEPSPVNLYGKSKVEGEAAVRARANGCVLRMPLLVGAGTTLADSGFVGQMVDAIKSPQAQPVDDVLMRFPTWTRDVANAIAFLLGRGEASTVHISGLRGGTRYAWTTEVAELLGLPMDHLTPSTDVVERVATRPPNSQLSPLKLQNLGFDGFTDFRHVVTSVLEEIG